MFNPVFFQAARSGQHSLYHFPVNIRQAELPALILVGQPFVVEAETMQDGRLQIVNVNLVLRDVEAQIVRRAVREAGASPGLAGEL